MGVINLLIGEMMENENGALFITEGGKDMAILRFVNMPLMVTVAFLRVIKYLILTAAEFLNIDM